MPAGSRLLIPFSTDGLTWGEIRDLAELGAHCEADAYVEYMLYNGTDIITDIIIQPEG